MLAWLLLELPLVTSEDWVEVLFELPLVEDVEVPEPVVAAAFAETATMAPAPTREVTTAPLTRTARARPTRRVRRVRAARASTAGAGIGRCGELSGCVVLMGFSFLFVGKVGREGVSGATGLPLRLATVARGGELSTALWWLLDARPGLLLTLVGAFAVVVPLAGGLLGPLGVLRGDTGPVVGAVAAGGPGHLGDTHGHGGAKRTDGAYGDQTPACGCGPAQL